MLEIRTVYGNFAKFEDLLKFMQEEGFCEVTVDTYCIFSKTSNLTFKLNSWR